MKANHNQALHLVLQQSVVVNISISKNESKSQRAWYGFGSGGVVVNISISKNESKSQLIATILDTILGCGKYQYFKE